MMGMEGGEPWRPKSPQVLNSNKFQMIAPGVQEEKKGKAQNI